MILVDPRSRSSSVVNSHQDVSITILSQISYSDGEWVLTIPRVRYFISSQNVWNFEIEGARVEELEDRRSRLLTDTSKTTHRVETWSALIVMDVK